jgi:quinoprotein glucose dehydrogenase
VLGDLKAKGAAEKLVPLLEDRSTRVQFFATIALGKIGHPPAVKSLLEVLRRNKDEDPWLRHAAVMGLVGCADDAALLSAASDESASVRMGVLLALRRHGSAEVARFLKDSDPLLVVEAARAINDAPINAAMEPLAALIEKPSDDAALMRRVVNANFRVGKPENAAALAKFAASTANEAMRVDALSALADWASPSPRDRVMGLWRPLPSRDGKPAADALQSALPNLFGSAPIAVQAAAAETAAKLRIKEAIAPLHQAAMEEKAPGKSRVAYMRALAELKDPQLADVVKPALNDKNSDVRKQAQRLVVQIGGDANLAIDVLKDVMKDGTISEKQAAIATLATMKTAAADQLLLKQMEMIGKPKLAKELELDLQLAAESRRKDNSEFDTRLKQMEKHWGNDPLGPYRAAMYGGDAEEGKKVFHDHPAAQCLRCHKMEGTGGEAGPDLSKVGSRGERPYLLESLIVPSAKIVPGYGTVVLTLKNGNVVAGALRSEENGKITMIDPANKTVEVNAADVASRTEPVSAMPPMGAVLSKKELRDVIEYLAGQK